MSLPIILDANIEKYHPSTDILSAIWTTFSGNHSKLRMFRHIRIEIVKIKMSENLKTLVLICERIIPIYYSASSKFSGILTSSRMPKFSRISMFSNYEILWGSDSSRFDPSWSDRSRVHTTWAEPTRSLLEHRILANF